MIGINTEQCLNELLNIMPATHNVLNAIRQATKKRSWKLYKNLMNIARLRRDQKVCNLEFSRSQSLPYSPLHVYGTVNKIIFRVKLNALSRA